MSKLRVWWIPQLPMRPFHIPVDSVQEGVKVMNILADYDLFQYENNIKPDYCNAGGIETLNEEGEWDDWFDEDSGEDDPRVFVDSIDI